MRRGDAAMFRRTQLYSFTVEGRNIGIYETALLRESVNSDGTLNNSVIYEADFPKALHAIIGIRCGMSLALENASLNNSKFFRLLVSPSLVLRPSYACFCWTNSYFQSCALFSLFFDLSSYFKGDLLHFNIFARILSTSFVITSTFIYIYIYIYIYIFLGVVRMVKHWKILFQVVFEGS
jgi:hypothetical protein